MHHDVVYLDGRNGKICLPFLSVRKDCVRDIVCVPLSLSLVFDVYQPFDPIYLIY